MAGRRVPGRRPGLRRHSVRSGAGRERERHKDRPEAEDDVRDEIGNFEEYTWLYAESWTPEPIRWLFSTVPTCMLLDDHDLRDDWNTSQAWRDRVTEQEWWPERVRGAFGSYWIYQHLGNLSPDDLANDLMYGVVRSDISDGERSRRLDAFAWRSDVEPESARWSFHRDFGNEHVGIRMLAVDARCSRVLDPADRRILDAPEREWLAEKAVTPLPGRRIDHLTSAPPCRSCSRRPFITWRGGTKRLPAGRGASVARSSARRFVKLSTSSTGQLSGRHSLPSSTC